MIHIRELCMIHIHELYMIDIRELCMIHIRELYDSHSCAYRITREPFDLRTNSEPVVRFVTREPIVRLRCPFCDS